MSDAVDGSIFGEGQPCFGCAPDHPIGFRLAFERDGDDVVTRFVPSERYQGPPTIMHGGLVATLADEIGAWALVLLLKRFGFTAEMHCKLRQPIRVGKAVLHEILEHWLPRLTPAGTATLVVQKNLGSDSLQRWLQERGWATTRLSSRAGYRLLEVKPR